MKITMKIAVLAVIAALIIPACENSVSLSDPDWDVARAQFDMEKIGTADVDTANNYLPTFSEPTGLNVGATTTNKVVIITFANNALKADVLKETDLGEVEKKLKEFLSFNSISLTTSGTPYAFSALNPSTDWKVIAKNNTSIDVSLDFLTPSISDNIIPVILGEKYTYAGGKKVDIDGDNVAGDPTYDIHYAPALTVTGATSSTYVAPGQKDWTLTIPALSGSTLGEQTVNISYTAAIGTDDAARDTILSALAGKFTLQKLTRTATESKWENVAAAAYDSTANTLGFKFTPGDLSIYRIIASGVKNVTTDAAYYGVKQKIKFAIAGGTATLAKDTIAGDGGVYYDSTAHSHAMAGGSGYTSPAVRYESDAFGKNVIVHIYFSNMGTLYSTNGLKSVTSDIITKNVKIAYRVGTTSTISATYDNSWEDIRFIGIKEGKVVNSPLSSGTAVLNEVVLTLDPDYKVDTSKSKYIFLSPALGFADVNNSSFYNYSNWGYAEGTVTFFEVLGPTTSF
jgi:hypothetical protein